MFHFIKLEKLEFYVSLESNVQSTMNPIWNFSGIFGLYRGISSNIVSSAPISALYTFTYESVKKSLLPLLPKVTQSFIAEGNNLTETRLFPISVILCIIYFLYDKQCINLMECLPFVLQDYQSLAHCTAGGCASIATSFIFTPSERIKQQMQVSSYYRNCWYILKIFMFLNML